VSKRVILSGIQFSTPREVGFSSHIIRFNEEQYLAAAGKHRKLLTVERNCRFAGIPAFTILKAVSYFPFSKKSKIPGLCLIANRICGQSDH
jgi:hypothetical protein